MQRQSRLHNHSRLIFVRLCGGACLRTRDSLPEVVMFSSDSIRATAWMSLGACRGEDPELFFPTAAASTARDQMTAARAVCQQCSVLGTCLSYAVSTAQDGIWGGTTSEERRALAVRSRERVPAAALHAVGLKPGRFPNGQSQRAVATSLLRAPVS
jgi:WhiB family redox-sensing transcriptional regulator